MIALFSGIVKLGSENDSCKISVGTAMLLIGA